MDQVLHLLVICHDLVDTEEEALFDQDVAPNTWIVLEEVADHLYQALLDLQLHISRQAEVLLTNFEVGELFDKLVLSVLLDSFLHVLCLRGLLLLLLLSQRHGGCFF